MEESTRFVSILSKFVLLRFAEKRPREAYVGWEGVAAAVLIILFLIYKGKIVLSGESNAIAEKLISEIQSRPTGLKLFMIEALSRGVNDALRNNPAVVEYVPMKDAFRWNARGDGTDVTASIRKIFDEILLTEKIDLLTKLRDSDLVFLAFKYWSDEGRSLNEQ